MMVQPTNYQLSDGRILTVRQSFNQKWGTFILEGSRASRRFKSNAVPMRNSRAEAQADLDEYAEARGLIPAEKARGGHGTAEA